MSDLHLIKKMAFSNAYDKGKNLAIKYGHIKRLPNAVFHIVRQNKANIGASFLVARRRELYDKLDNTTSKAQKQSLKTKISEIEHSLDTNSDTYYHHHSSLRSIMPEIFPRSYSATNEAEYHHILDGVLNNGQYHIFHSLRNEHEEGHEYEDFIDDLGEHFEKGVYDHLKKP